MKKPQWITISVAVIAIAVVYRFGRITPLKKQIAPTQASSAPAEALTDTILNLAKRQIKPEQLAKIISIENSIPKGAGKEQQLSVYHQLGHYWGDTIGFFLPYAWYEAEGARLENSEKTLTFAARLFLENLQHEQTDEFRRWEALQAKDLFERSLRINPGNDSAKIGLGACYMFGNISDAPMEGIRKIMDVLKTDSNNVYAHMMLAKGALMSQQYDKAASRLITVNHLQPENAEATLLLAEVYERTNDKTSAVKWYQESLKLIKREDARAEIKKRIEELK